MRDGLTNTEQQPRFKRAARLRLPADRSETTRQAVASEKRRGLDFSSQLLLT